MKRKRKPVVSRGVPMVNPFSLVGLKAEFLCNDEVAAHGTCFLYAHRGTGWIITNWHNVTGREPGSYKRKSGLACPEHIRFKIMISIEETEEGGTTMQAEFKVPLYVDAERRNPRWFEHPQHKDRIDVVAIPFGPILVDGVDYTNQVIYANDPRLGLFDSMAIRPGDDAFILGFPRGIAAGGLAIWKRGSIASEPEVAVAKLPLILIDAATREGMSGAPVYVRNPNPDYKSVRARVGVDYRFLGIYSGRLGTDDFKAQLGLVWRDDAIQQIIDGQLLGTPSDDYTSRGDEHLYRYDQ